MRNENRETVADIVAEMRKDIADGTVGIWSDFGGEIARSYADRIEAAEKREDSMWRAAFAKIEAVVTLQHAKRNLGEQARRAVSEIMSACRFPDGALDEYERDLEENARLRAALKPVLECKVMSAMTAEIEPGRSDYCATIIEKAQRIYNELNEREVR